MDKIPKVPKVKKVEKILPISTMNLPPTGKQARAITKLAMALHISEPIENSPSNRWEARNLIYYLRGQLKGKKGT